MKILLAVDGSVYTRKMLDYLISHSAIFDPAHEYTLLNAQPPLPAACAVGRGRERGAPLPRGGGASCARACDGGAQSRPA